MPEFEYRGYRIRTIFDTSWHAKVWPPLNPPRAIERLKATRAEGEDACRTRATAAVDAHLERVGQSE